MRPTRNAVVKTEAAGWRPAKTASQTLGGAPLPRDPQPEAFPPSCVRLAGWGAGSGKPARARLLKRALASLAIAVLASWPVRAWAQPTAPAASTSSTINPTSGSSSTEEVSVRGVRSSHDIATISVGAQEAQDVAGTEGDPVKVVHDLPGVARPSFSTGQLILWGSSPQDTRTYVDGVEVPALFHGAALRSTLNADLVRDVTLTPGAYGVDYGRGLGGLVRVETRDLLDAGVHGYVGADALDGSAMIRAAVNDRFRVAAAGRYGWLDGVLRAVDAPNVDTFFAIPRYGDYQAKAQIDLRLYERLDAVLLGSDDALTVTIPDADPSRIRGQKTGTSFQRFYLRYVRALDDGSSVVVTPWFGHDGSTLRASFGGTPAELDAFAWRGGLRAAHRSRQARWLAMTLGIDADGASANVIRAGSLQIPPREGDIFVFGRPPGPDVNTDSWSPGAVDVAPYAQLDFDAGPLLVSPGLRVDGFLMTSSRQTPRIGSTPPIGLSHLEATIEPRISMRLQITERLSLLGAAGLYSQPPDPADLSAVFGNPRLGPGSAEHATLGESLRITETLSAEVVAFAKWMDNLAFRNPSPTPRLALALVQTGAGRSYGVEFFVRQRPWRGLSGWVSYTISRGERRDELGDGWRLFDNDQPHVLTVVATKVLGAWSFGARLRVATGLPRTPVTGAFYDAKDDQYAPLFGAQNSVRLPDFWQVDVRIDRNVPLGRGLALRVYVEALNVTGNANGEEYVYNIDYTRRGTVHGLPFVALAGARVDL
jgi:hypothetical protein